MKTRLPKKPSPRKNSSRTTKPMRAPNEPLHEPDAHEIVRAISEGEVDAVVVLDKEQERVVSLADFGTVSELHEVVRAIRQGEVDAFLMNEGGNERVYTLASIEQALRESESRFREMAESMPCVVFSADERGAPEYFNASWWEFTGFSKSDAASFDFTRVLRKEDQDRFRTTWNGCIAKGDCFETELPFVGRQHHEPRWHLVKMVPVRNGEGVPRRWLGTCTDIDRMKRAELELAQQRSVLQEIAKARTQELEESQNRLRVSERMAVLGTLSAGIGHDITNLLFPMTAHLDALNRAKMEDSAASSVQTLRVLVDHLRQLVRGIRAFAVDPFHTSGERTTSLSDWWSDAEPLLSITAPKSIAFECNIPKDLPAAALSSAAITQVVFNLVHNSVQVLAGRTDGKISVRATLEKRQPETIVLEVHDNGPGMDEQTRQRCLEPFFTTKAGSNSTGLGLALVNQIIRQAGGTVEIESEQGKGTRVLLRVPVAKA